MLLSLLLACSERPEIRPSTLPKVEVVQTPPTPTVPVVEESEPRIERFTLETLDRLTPAGQAPPPCFYLARFNEYGGYTTEMNSTPGVPWDVLVAPVMDTVTVRTGSNGENESKLVKVLVPDSKYGDQWVQVNWFPAEAFSANPTDSPAFGQDDLEPTIYGSCTVPEEPKPTPVAEVPAD